LNEVGEFVTITRVGTNEKYASNWDTVFGGKKKSVSSPKASDKATPKAAKKAVKKQAAVAPKKKAAPAKPAKKTAKSKKK
jgi:hypothetical protein